MMRLRRLTGWECKRAYSCSNNVVLLNGETDTTFPLQLGTIFT